MKKFFGKMLGITLIFVLIITTPVHAITWEDLSELSVSFDFSVNSEFSQVLSGDVPRWRISSPEYDILANGVAVGVTGTVVAEGRTASVFMEIDIDLEQLLGDSYQQMLPMLGTLNVDLSEPFRIWIETDFTDLNNPAYLIVIEVPTFIRMALMFADASLTSQYWVIDLSDLIAEELADIDVEYEINKLISEYTIADLIAELEAEIASMLEYMEEEADVFAYGFDILENGDISAFFNFVMTHTYRNYTETIDFAFSGEITNINAAEIVPLPLPQLTAGNSLDLLKWMNDTTLRI